MEKRLTKEELIDIYKIESHKWMEIVSEGERDHLHYKTYLQQKKRLRNIYNHITINSKPNVAEFGSGNGLWGELIHHKVNSYVGIDFSKPFVELATKRHRALNITNSQFVCEDIIEFSAIYIQKFDMAFSLDFSEHIYDQDFISIFSAIKNTLRQNGELYIHTPNGNYFLEMFKKWGIMKQIIGHIGIRTPHEHIALLEQIGFKEITISYLPHYLKILSRLHFMSYIPFFGKFFKARLLISCKK